MKALFLVSLLLGLCGSLVAGCGSTLSDDCEFTKTCAVPCNDPTVAQQYPGVCIKDGGLDENAADAPGAEVEDAISSDNTAEDRSVTAPDASFAEEGDSSDELDASGEMDVVEVVATTDSSDTSPGEAEAGPSCDGSLLPNMSACVIDEHFGVFVSPTGNDGAAGTRDAPFKTLTHAIGAALASGKRVYACDDGTGYSESLMIDAQQDGVSLFGKFSCTDWSYSIIRDATVLAPAGMSPLVVHGPLTRGILIQDFVFQAVDATSAGTSSIGAIVDGASGVVLRGVRIVAGRGAAGANGLEGAAGSDGIVSGSPPVGNPATCIAGAGVIQQPGGGWLIQSACGSKGGNGGSGNKDGMGSPGQSGNPSVNVIPPGRTNGGGNGSPGGNASPAGAPGAPGTAGTPAATLGTFTSTGYSAAPPGFDGTAGFPGQGGGGGGGSDSPFGSGCLGASGGAGGMGGCGGTQGKGGQAGGASVALLVWMSQVTLDNCALVPNIGGTGGTGGNGGVGGAGQPGGPGGAGLTTDAGISVGHGGNGGIGGNGGAGGPGAGGNGGPSYGLVYRGVPPFLTGNTYFTSSDGGAPGSGGSSPGVMAAPTGTAGDAKMQLSIPTEGGAP